MRFALAGLAALFLVACGGGTTKPMDTPPQPASTEAPVAAHEGHDDGSPAPEINPAEGTRLVVEEGALLIDVRTAEEYDARHIDGAKRIGVEDIAERVAEIEKMAGGKDKPIVVYCGAGRRAGRAQAALEDAGFSAVTNLGGVDDWECEAGTTCHKGSRVGGKQE